MRIKTFILQFFNSNTISHVDVPSCPTEYLFRNVLQNFQKNICDGVTEVELSKISFSNTHEIICNLPHYGYKYDSDLNCYITVIFGTKYYIAA